MASEREGGFIYLHRQTWSSPDLADFKGQHLAVFFTVLHLANWKPGFFWVGTERVEVGRGELAHSIKTIAREARVSLKVARATLDKLLGRKILEAKKGTQEGTGIRVLRVCNYEKYQTSTPTDGTQEGTPRARVGHGEGTPRAQIEEGEERKKGKKKETTAPEAPLPEGTDWSGLLAAMSREWGNRYGGAKLAWQGKEFKPLPLPRREPHRRRGLPALAELPRQRRQVLRRPPGRTLPVASQPLRRSASARTVLPGTVGGRVTRRPAGLEGSPMTSTLAYLDGLPLGPVALFGLGYLALLLTVLAWLRTRRTEERCERCGGYWRRTERGNAFHALRPARTGVAVSKQIAPMIQHLIAETSAKCGSENTMTPVLRAELRALLAVAKAARPRHLCDYDENWWAKLERALARLDQTSSKGKP